MALHYFDKDVAVKYGIEPAILLNNIYYWVEKNKANNASLHDGYYWTYNSARAFSELFPYMSETKIRRSLKVLENEGLIVTGNYNKMAYDRTMWYALTEKGLETLKSTHSSNWTNASCKNDKCILQNEQMDVSEMQNGFGQNARPIPNNNTDNNPNINTYIPYQQIADMYNETCPSLSQVVKLTDSRKKAIKARLKSYTIEDFELVFRKAEASTFLTGKGSTGWKANFDWLIKETNMTKVLEGNYDDKISQKDDVIAQWIAEYGGDEI